MYVSKGSLARASDIEQGDLLEDFLLPAAPTENAIHRRASGTTTSQPVLLNTRVDIEDPANLELVVSVQRALVLVVGNTCDIAGGGVISVVPTEPRPWKGWKETQRHATGGNWAKSFYLGAQKSLGIARLQAILPNIVTVDGSYVQRLITGTPLRRLAGLNTDGLMHLRWALAYCFGRNAREETQWVTDDDLLALLDEAESAKGDKAIELQKVLTWALPEARRRGLAHRLLKQVG